VIEAENGVAGLGMVEVNDIDLVVTDIVMPEKEGLEVIRTLRADRPGLPVIAITGGGGDASKALSYAEWADIIGAKVVLQKPFDREELTMAVRVALS
jgi:CheY-like chemotaxis protein